MKRGEPGPERLAPGSSFTWSPYHIYIFQLIKPVWMNIFFCLLSKVFNSGNFTQQKIENCLPDPGL